MSEIKNCYNCRYRNQINEKMACNRPLDTEGRMAQVGKIEMVCPCHSDRDLMKKQGLFMDTGVFHPSRATLKELEKFIFGNADK